MHEADLAGLSDLLPDDLELDPEATRYQVSDERLSRGIVSARCRPRRQVLRPGTTTTHL
jgi:hypothetical protein